MKIISGINYLSFLKKFEQTYIDLSSKYYQLRIKQLKNYSDGYCYDGYYWDCLKNKKPTNEKFCDQYLNNKENLFVFWDNHSKDNIFIDNYWKYGKKNILQLKSNEFFKIKNYLPEDIYVTDFNQSFIIVYSHEYIQNDRYCLFEEK